MSTALAELQRDFIAAVLDGSPLAHATSPRDGIEVYRDNAAATFRGALAAAYPVVARLVGEAFFAEAVRRYMHAHPSASGDLHELGSAFGEFLDRYAPAGSLPYLPDAARLEWAFHESAHAADAPVFDFAALAAVPASSHGSLRARLAPSVRHLESAHPVLALWEANQPDRDGVPRVTEGGDCVLVWREGLTPMAQRLEPAEWRFLQALAAGDSLESAAARLGAEEARMPELLARWTRCGVIAALDLPAAA
jgi:hypothetical protein